MLVFHDLLGLGNRPLAKFVREYARSGPQVTEAIGRFATDVRSGAFPGPAETYARERRAARCAWGLTTPSGASGRTSGAPSEL